MDVSKSMQKFIDVAMGLPEVEEGMSCNKLAYKAGKKGFMYIGQSEAGYDVKLKLGEESIGEMEGLAEKEPDYYHLGPSGWIEIRMPHGKAPAVGKIRKWVKESFVLLVPKKISKGL